MTYDLMEQAAIPPSLNQVAVVNAISIAYFRHMHIAFYLLFI